jgi:hypothetical protein
MSKFKLGLSEFSEVYLIETPCPCSFNGITNQTPILFFETPGMYLGRVCQC